MSYQQEERFLTEKRKRFDDIQELPENRPALLLAAIYSGDEQKIYLKFYDMKDNTIYFWRDRTNHKPYCYTKMQHSDAIKKIAEKEKKYAVYLINFQICQCKHHFHIGYQRWFLQFYMQPLVV